MLGQLSGHLPLGSVEHPVFLFSQGRTGVGAQTGQSKKHTIDVITRMTNVIFELERTLTKRKKNECRTGPKKR